MDESRSTVAQQVAQVAIAFERQRTGHAPESVAVVLGGDTMVVTLRGALSPAERALARSPAGAAQVQEFHRQLFASSSDSLFQEIRRITGVQVREAALEVEPATGTVVQAFTTGTTVQVFLLTQSVPSASWSGSAPAKQMPTMTRSGQTHHRDEGEAEAGSGDAGLGDRRSASARPGRDPRRAAPGAVPNQPREMLGHAPASRRTGQGRLQWAPPAVRLLRRPRLQGRPGKSGRGMNTPMQTEGTAAEVRLMLGRARHVWRLVPRRHKWALGGAAVVMACTSACGTALALFLGLLVDGVQRGTQQGQPGQTLHDLAAWYLGLIGAAYLLREILNVARRFLVTNTCARINQDMSIQLMAHLMTVPLATLAREKVGTLHGRIFRSVDGLVRFLRLNFLEFIPALFTGLFALAATVGKQPLMGLVMIGVIPMTVFLTVRQLLSQKGIRLQLMRSSEEIDGTVVEQLSGIEYVRAADTRQREINRLAKATEKRRSMEVRHHFQMSLFGGAKALNEGLFHILVLAFAIYLAIHGRITFGDVLTFSILFLNVMAPLGEVHRILDEGHESSLQVGELLGMLSEPVDPSFLTTTVRVPQLLPGEPAILVDNLHVEYSTPEDKRPHTLHGVSLTICHGETIGVAGRSGGGKSTFLRVLLRLIHPCGGRVLVGGVPIEAVSRGDVGRLFGYVGQSPFVFAGTVAENIAYGSENRSLDDIRRAAEMAHLHEEILLMPGGYQAAVTERGQNLSGGQRQRLALARVLLKQPPVLILDEATSALDNISERQVQSALGLTSADRTTILVAHRLSTLRDADRIVVFDEGRIVEVGSYDGLVEAGGVFAELVLSAESGARTTGSPEPRVLAEPVASP